MKKFKNVSIAVLTLLICLTVGFIWGNSLPSKAQSSKTSSGVYAAVKPVLDVVFGVDKVTHGTFRKMAHFSEFFLLGAEVSLLYLLIFGFDWKKCYLVFLFGLVVAAIDETIQIFTGRGAAVLDVIIDYLGYLTACASFILIGVIRSVIIKNRNNKEKS